MNNDGPRRQGRFLKKSSSVYDKVIVQEFSFKEIGQGRAIDLDNPARTIIHTQYHAEADLAHSIVEPEFFDADLLPADRRRPVIALRDFTKDWERDRRMRKDRVSRNEDEDFDGESGFTGEPSGKVGDDEEAHEVAIAEQPNTTATPATAQTAEAAQGTTTRGLPQHYSGMDIVGNAIKDFVDADEDVTGIQRKDPLAKVAQHAEFIPVETSPAPATEPVQSNIETPAVDAYRQRLALAEQNKQVLAELEEEAKASGYTAGFKIGEEKGELQTRQNASAMFSKINELIGEFATLRNAVLDNVQQNFYELAQAVAEALLKREFKVSPDAFATVVRRAIAEAVGPAKFKIRLNPELYDRVAAIGPSDIVENLVKDADVDVGDFKIESDLSVVDVSVRKLISDLLDQADLDLFDTQKKDKAG